MSPPLLRQARRDVPRTHIPGSAGPDSESRVSRWPASMTALGGVPVALVAAAATAYLGANGLWFAPVAVILAIPLAIALHRFPLSGIMIWLVAMPFLIDDAGGALRRVFWATHRLIPVLVLFVILASARLGFRSRPLPRLGWPEVAMAVYVLLTLLSVLYLSQSDRALYVLYDRIVVPMVLYLIVRLEEPDTQDLQRFLPVVVFLLVTQAAIGWVAWLAPSLLPSAWLDRAGTRTTGSVRSVAIYGTTMVFAAAYLLHGGWQAQLRRHRTVLLGGAMLAGVMIFMTFSRASWLAGLGAFVLLGVAYRGLLRRTLFVAVPILAVTIAFTGTGDFLSYADQRFLSQGSEQSALSRLPVAYAAFNMFQERPVWGFGFGNFEEFDRQYQEAIPGLVVPEKDHASHNTYLTILAEQGLSGLVFYLAPVAWWLGLAIPAGRRLPREGLWSRQLLIALWVIILSFVIVNNFSDMQISFGLGMWWLTLGLIGAVTTKALRTDRGTTRRLHDEESAASRVSAQIPGSAALRSIASRREDRMRS